MFGNVWKGTYSLSIHKDGYENHDVAIMEILNDEITVDVELIEIIIEPFNLDRHKILQIIINLITNARQALVAGESEPNILNIRTYRSNDNVVIEVSDNGVGISAENMAKMFTHGFTTKKEGHGFGLHGCVKMAQEMNGSLTCHSDGEGKGAVFTLELPMESAKQKESG